MRTKCGTHVLDGTPIPVIRTKDSAYNGNLWQVPITAQSSTDATDHDALQPLRGRSGLCPLAHPSIHPITPATSEQTAGAPRPKRWGGAPFSINEGRPQRASPASLKDKRRKNTIKPAWLSHSHLILTVQYMRSYRINCTVTPHNVAVGFMR